MSLWPSIRAYAAHEDPLVAGANLIALVVGANQPFYPLYLYWIVGAENWPSFFTLLSTPFFLAVPAIARRNSWAGRALLPMTGIADTAFSAKLFGEASGVELFLLPCVLLATLLFRRSERIVSLSVTGLAFLVFTVLHGRYGVPFHTYTAEEYTRLLDLNAFSVGTLTAFVGLTFSNAFAQIEGRK